MVPEAPPLVHINEGGARPRPHALLMDLLGDTIGAGKVEEQGSFDATQDDSLGTESSGRTSESLQTRMRRNLRTMTCRVLGHQWFIL